MSAKSDINVIIFNFEALRTSHSECPPQPPMLQPLDYCAQVRLDLKRIVANTDTKKGRYTMVTFALAEKCM